MLVGTNENVSEYSNIALVDGDPEVEAIRVTIQLKDGITKPSSMVIERATLTWMSQHFPAWSTYCIENGMKTL